MLTPSLDVWQRGAVALVEYACGYDKGRGKDDPVYLHDVTQGRDIGAERAHYSSCADLPHWMLWRKGCREPWVNRDDHATGREWVPGRNISDLAWSPLAFHPGADWVVATGDILILWNAPDTRDSHALVALGLTGFRLRTGNYGAGGMSPSSWPGARIGSAELARRGDAWWYGAKRVQRAIRLADAVPYFREPPSFRGAAMTGEDLDALRAID